MQANYCSTSIRYCRFAIYVPFPPWDTGQEHTTHDRVSPVLTRFSMLVAVISIQLDFTLVSHPDDKCRFTHHEPACARCCFALDPCLPCVLPPLPFSSLRS
ncbi:Uncharacterized protein HZ326_8071 [Fusarium oxysporum f. sp. albedinis]|nr:Uncharacterized protein HZ326_8071 [Fusarium oxysporum f. sp. albedinis]